MRTILLSILFAFSLDSYAQTFVGTFVMTKGDVKILRAPSASPKGPFLVYEGKKFSYQKARIGRKIKGNELIQTGTDGRAKVVYPNGDHFNLGPGTSMSMPSPEKGGKGKKGSNLNLFYGKVRSLISYAFKLYAISNIRFSRPLLSLESSRVHRLYSSRSLWRWDICG